jgi:putative flippase GtrA
LQEHAGAFVKFSVVGVIGFLVDAAVLFASMRYLGAGPLAGRAASVPAAMISTWLLNRAFTFAVRRRASAREAARYALAKGAGLLANLSIYSAIVFLIPQNGYPLMALVAATGAAAILNFALLRKFVFPAG